MKIQIETASAVLQNVCPITPLQLNQRMSELYAANIYLKREDLQTVRSYKIRGAYNKISSLNNDEKLKGLVCASAGNHAQGVAYSCKHLGIEADIYMPSNTPRQKIGRVKKWGADLVRIHLIGDTYDDACYEAMLYAETSGKAFIHPFDDEKVIEGQGTVAKEITDVLPAVDYVIVPVGGGGLAAGVGTWFSENSTSTKLIAVEPAGAASLTAAMANGKPVLLDRIDSFVDGAAVRKIGALNFPVIQQSFHAVQTVPEGEVCQTLLELYNEEGMIVEPAGALTIAALDQIADEIKGKTVVCIVSGGNNDVARMEEIRKLAEAWEGLHHHFVIRFKHYPDGLAELFNHQLGEGNHVTRLEYARREHGRSTYGLIGIRSDSYHDYAALRKRWETESVEFKQVGKDDFLFKYWV